MDYLEYKLGTLEWKKTFTDEFSWYWQGGFQAGAGVFFYHLFLITKKEKYLTLGLKPLADGFLKKFIKQDGSLFIYFDPVKKKYIEADYSMHHYNDDFSCLALICAFLVFDEEKYLEGASKFAHWLYHQQKEDGNFSDYPATQATSIILFCNLNKIKAFSHLLKSAKKSAAFILKKQQVIDNFSPNVYGALYGENMKQEYVGARCSAYGISALLMLDNPKNKIFFMANPF